MKWYWPVDCSNTVDKPLITDAHDFGPIDELQLRIGQPVQDWTPFAWLRATQPEDDGDPDDVLQTHIDVLVYSSRLRRALEQAGIQGIQFLPVRVFRPGGEELEGFSIANVIERRAILDLSASDYDVYPEDYFLPERRGKVAGIRKAVLRQEALHGCDIVRPDEFKVDLYVSERFKDTFERGGFTGYSFYERKVS